MRRQQALLSFVGGLTIFAGACGSSGPPQPLAPAVDVTGTWTGPIQSSLLLATNTGALLTQTGATVTGTFGLRGGGTGTVTGTVAGTVFTFTLAVTTGSCTGSFTGTAAVTDNSMALSFTGSDCSGTHSNGQGMLTRPDPATSVFGTAVDVQLTDAGEVQNMRDLTGNLEVLVVDGNGTFTSYPGAGAPLGIFTVNGVPSGSYYLHIDNSYVVTSSRTVDLSAAHLGRSGVEAAPTATAIAVDVDGLSAWNANDEIEIVATNAGVNHSLLGFFGQGITDGASTVAGLSVAWSGLPLLDSAKGDTALVAQLVSTQTDSGVSYAALAKIGQTSPFAIAAGDVTAVSAGTLVDVPQDLNVLLDVKRSAFADFAAQVHPAATLAGQQVFAFGLPAARRYGYYGPGPDLFIASLGSSYYDLSTGIMTFGSAYPDDWDLVGSLQMSYVNSYALAGARFPPRVVGAITHTDTLEALGSKSVEPLVGPVGSPQVGGVDAFLDITGTGTTPLLSWTAPALGTVSYYVVGVTHLHLVNNRTAQDTVATIYTTDTSVRIPPNVLVEGESYVFVIGARNAAGVDVQKTPFKRTLPTGVAQVLSGLMVP